jgi:hypothetical protein
MIILYDVFAALISLEELKEVEVMSKYGVQTDVEVLDMLDTLATQKEVFYFLFSSMFTFILCT